jgi:hypothetical protein
MHDGEKMHIGFSLESQKESDQYEDFRSRSEDNIKMGLREIVWGSTD